MAEQTVDSHLLEVSRVRLLAAQAVDIRARTAAGQAHDARLLGKVTAQLEHSCGKPLPAADMWRLGHSPKPEARQAAVQQVWETSPSAGEASFLDTLWLALDEVCARL